MILTKLGLFEKLQNYLLKCQFHSLWMCASFCSHTKCYVEIIYASDSFNSVKAVVIKCVIIVSDALISYLIVISCRLVCRWLSLQFCHQTLCCLQLHRTKCKHSGFQSIVVYDMFWHLFVCLFWGLTLFECWVIF